MSQIGGYAKTSLYKRASDNYLIRAIRLVTGGGDDSREETLPTSHSPSVRRASQKVARLLGKRRDYAAFELCRLRQSKRCEVSPDDVAGNGVEASQVNR